MALATFTNGIDTVRGALDSVKEGQAKRARLVCRWRPQGPQSYDEDGSKIHELFYMHFHEGPWSEACVHTSGGVRRGGYRTGENMAAEVRGVYEDNPKRKHAAL